MDEFIKAIISFFSYKGLHIGYKLSVIILVILGLFLVDDLIGFSRHYILNSKLEQIIELKQIDPNILTNDPLIKSKYLELKEDIIRDKSKTEGLLEYIQSSTVGVKSKSAYINKQIVATDGLPNITINWLTLTVMGDFYIAIILMTGAMFWNLFDFGLSLKERITGSVALLILIPFVYLLGLLYKLIISFVPIFISCIWINYSINMIVPLLITTGLILYKRKVDAKKGNGFATRT